MRNKEIVDSLERHVFSSGSHLGERDVPANSHFFPLRDSACMQTLSMENPLQELLVSNNILTRYQYARAFFRGLSFLLPLSLEPFSFILDLGKVNPFLLQ